MNELILLGVAFFIFCFGSLILNEIFRFGKADYYTVRPIYDNQNITPLELQRMRNHNHQTLKNIGNASVEIEYTQPNRLTK